MADRSTIGNRIRELREEKKLTQEQFAQEFHVSRETVSLWERGERDIKTDVTVKMSDFFGVTCDYILRGIESDHVDIHRATGLSDKAISMLETGFPALKITNPKAPDFCSVVSMLLEDKERMWHFYRSLVVAWRAGNALIDSKFYTHHTSPDDRINIPDSDFSKKMDEFNSEWGKWSIPIDAAYSYFKSQASDYLKSVLFDTIDSLTGVNETAFDGTAFNYFMTALEQTNGGYNHAQEE